MHLSFSMSHCSIILSIESQLPDLHLSENFAFNFMKESWKFTAYILETGAIFSCLPNCLWLSFFQAVMLLVFWRYLVWILAETLAVLPHALLFCGVLPGECWVTTVNYCYTACMQSLVCQFHEKNSNRNPIFTLFTFFYFLLQIQNNTFSF